MNRLFLLPLTLLAVPALAGSPTLVTLTSGEVKLGADAAPATPFVLPEAGALTLADGASVVVLHEGTATRVRGPATVDLSSLGAPSTGGGADKGALDAVLTRQVSFARAGASRGGDLRLVRPVPGGTVLAPASIAWRCDGCGAQDVQVYDFMNDKVVWTGKGEGRVAYAGPALAPGAYVVSVGGNDFSFTVAPAEAQAELSKARRAADAAVQGLKAQGVDDVAAATSIPASVYVKAGLASEALWVLDAAVDRNPGNADLARMRTELEERVGIAEP